MQTIQFRVSDNYFQIILSLLQSLKQGMIEDLSIVKNEYKPKQIKEKIDETITKSHQKNRDSWQSFIDSTYGSFRDEPITRAYQGKYEQRELFE